MKINLFTIIPLAAVCFFSACSTRPSYVLSEKQMESVLYDLYLAETVIDENYYIFNNDSTAKQKMLNFVFEKHKIKEQTFDTSLVWYNENMEKYLKINNKVSERLALWADNLKEIQNRLDEERRRAEIRNLFPETTYFFLQSSGLFQNNYSFHTDSVQIQSILSYDLSFNVLGIRDSVFPYLSICFQTADTVFVERDTVKSNGLYSKVFSVPENTTVKEIYGSFRIPDEEKVLILFNNIMLQKQENQVATMSPKQEMPLKSSNLPR
ncbi:MAG: DUF4296 domain-containing protein [Dysgonamonadaceae bacterium]|nr:DUF4296 domain-containing protein [Dysgonamonadaceae bacterium]